MDPRPALTALNVPFSDHTTSGKVSRGWVGVKCPSCRSESPKLGINLTTGYATCWVCGPQRLGYALSALSGIPVGEVLRVLEDTTGFVDYQRPERRPKGKYDAARPDPVPMKKYHKDYLRGRDHDPDTLARLWGVQGTNPLGTLPHRLFIPVVRHGVPVSWTTRSVGGSKLRYVSALPAEESEPIHDCLFGLDYVRNACVVVEGPFDAMRVGPGAVATLGLSVTPVQKVKLSEIPVRVVVFDNSEEAQQRAHALADSLAVFGGYTAVVKLSGDDPDTSPAGEIEELRRTYLEDGDG